MDKPSVLERFNAGYEIVTESGCWLWDRKFMDKDGYGFMTMLNSHGAQRRFRAHRFSWELANAKQIPDGMCVLHLCDVACCVNPYHLMVGTHKENARQMVVRGRGPDYLAAERFPRAKLGYQRARDARRMFFEEGKAMREIRELFGVSHATIWNALYNKSWREENQR